MTKLHRRALLRGLGGAVIALPFLEIMEPRKNAYAAYDGVSRFVLHFAGSSHPPNDLVVPDSTGADYQLKRAMLSLESVKQHVTVVSGLKVPWQGSRGSADVPPGGRVAGFHHSTPGPIITGTRALDPYVDVQGPSPDHIIVREISPSTRFPYLSYRVQPEPYRGSGSGGTLSYSAANTTVNPIASPRLAYEQLFSGFVPATDPSAAERRALLARNHSVIDLVADRAQRLRSRLGRADQQRLEQHFTEVRSLEMRLAQIPEPMADACQIPQHPGEDPATSTYESTSDLTIGYAGEERRASVLVDLIHMAFVCDQSRVVSWLLTYPQCFMSAREILGGNVNLELHELGHNSDMTAEWADANSWEKKHFAQLIAKLAATPEGGGTLLDRTALVSLQEGGYGYDPEGGNVSSHSTENMVAIIAGNPSRLNLGQHLAATDRHPAEVTLAAMRSIGVTSSLGDLSMPIDSLLR